MHICTSARTDLGVDVPQLMFASTIVYPNMWGHVTCLGVFGLDVKSYAMVEEVIERRFRSLPIKALLRCSD